MSAAGTTEQAEHQQPGSAVDLTRADTAIPDSAAESAGTPGDAEDNDLRRRLSKQGWEGAVIKSELHRCPQYLSAHVDDARMK